MCRCLLAKAYNAAAQLLELELTEFDPARTAVSATDLLLYCYYGGMVATGALLAPDGAEADSARLAWSAFICVAPRMVWLLACQIETSCV
jgi:hypothetical protein